MQTQHIPIGPQPATHRLRFGILAAFVLGLSLMLGACGSSTEPTTSPTITLDGNTTNGQVVFNQRCSSCHTPSTQRSIGPGLAGILSADGPVLPAGIDYGGNLPNGSPRTPENVAAWIENGGRGEIGVMPPQMLSPEQLSDLLAYLATLQR